MFLVGYLSNLQPGRIWHKVILMWEAMHKSRHTWLKQKFWTSLAFSDWGAPDAEQLIQPCKAYKAWGKVPPEFKCWIAIITAWMLRCASRQNTQYECHGVVGWYLSDGPSRRNAHKAFLKWGPRTNRYSSLTGTKILGSIGIIQLKWS